MGAWIGWGIAKYALDRFISLMIGGAGPYDTDGDELTRLSQEMVRFWRQAPEVLEAAGESMYGKW